MSPTLEPGKVCYLEIPTTELELSANFYGNVFGWITRRRADGALAFDDTTGEVSGAWVTDRAPTAEPGVLVYIWVEDAEATAASIVEHGGEIVQPVGRDLPEITARFRDPAGNVLGIYQDPTEP